MKKILTSAMMLALAMTATAGEYQVYNNGTLGTGVTPNHWWNATYAFDTPDPTDANVKTFSFNTTDGGADGSMGLLCNEETVLGPLHSATLSFDWYAVGTGKYTIRLSADLITNDPSANKEHAEQDYTFEVTADNAGAWKSTTLNVAEKYPQVVAIWDKGATGFLFSVVVKAASGDAKIYFNNIKYTNTDDAWEAPVREELAKPTTVPTPTTPAADVMSLFSSAYDAATTFSIGGWGQSTQATVETIDGKEVYALKSFNYLGWELAKHLNISDMQYMHVDYWTPNGTSFGFTPISPAKEKVWTAPTVNKEEWNSYDVALSEFPIDLADLFQVKFDLGGGATGYIANVYFYKKGNTDPDPDVPVDPSKPAAYEGSATGKISQTIDGTTTEYSYTLKYSIVYNADKTLTFTPVIEWADDKTPVGLVPWMNVYVNEKENAMAEGVTSVTTTDTYNAGDVLAIRFFKPYALGDFHQSISYTVGTTSGVETIGEEAGEAVYYDLRGVRVANPEHGIFIRVQGNKATKIAR